jgi:hypothetical protein
MRIRDSKADSEGEGIRKKQVKELTRRRF